MLTPEEKARQATTQRSKLQARQAADRQSSTEQGKGTKQGQQLSTSAPTHSSPGPPPRGGPAHAHTTREPKPQPARPTRAAGASNEPHRSQGGHSRPPPTAWRATGCRETSRQQPGMTVKRARCGLPHAGVRRKPGKRTAPLTPRPHPGRVARWVAGLARKGAARTHVDVPGQRHRAAGGHNATTGLQVAAPLAPPPPCI